MSNCPMSHDCRKQVQTEKGCTYRKLCAEVAASDPAKPKK